MDAASVKRVLQAFAEEQVEYVVFGGVALNLLGLARATVDLDVFISASAENVDRLKRALKRVYDDPEIDGITSEDLLGDYPAVQYVPPEGAFYIDILTRLGEMFTYDNLAAQTIEYGGLPVRVVTPATLYAMKKDTVRPKDHVDAAALRERFGLEE